MLLELHVKNLALIEEEEISFSEGLNILTGETGAGKSMVIGSCLAALGARADKSLIREGAEYALIEMTLRADSEQQKEVLKQEGLEPEEDGTVLIQRRIYPGRNVCRICGETVTLKQCAAVGQAFIDVYGQKDHFLLLNRDNQLKALDEFAGDKAAALLVKMKECHSECTRLQRELEAVSTDSISRNRELDILSYEINEIEAAALAEGEDEQLEQVFKRLSSMERIHNTLMKVYACTGDEDGGAAQAVGTASYEMSSLSGLDRELEPLAGQLMDIEALLGDFNRSLMNYMENAVPDEGELMRIGERLDVINHIKDKYGPALQDVERTLQELKQRADGLEHAEERRRSFEEQLAKAMQKAEETASELSAVRKEAAAVFSEQMETSLKNLNFVSVIFRTVVESGTDDPDIPVTAAGFDRVSFQVSLNPGEMPHPLEQTASGGELSRIMLAMKTVIAGSDEGHTFIFDEIDSGISGQTAWKVSGEMGRLSRHHQILCITHLPQIAAMSDTHFEIYKTSQGGRTFTHIRRLDDEQGITELARLRGG
ncbi:MAG: DNA repair protein RecN [Lachnospiraceae bacterium]|nr:DNA repair protein RecN [Lachnospiraceae bacterium]